MKIVGCDYHPGHQQVSILDTETGEEREMKLGHADGQAERFYRELEAPTLIGMEAVGNSLWFEQMVERLGAISCGSETRRRSVRRMCASRRRTSGTPGTF